MIPPVLEKGPCGQPCEHPCDEPCDDRPAADGTQVTSWWGKLFKSGLVNTLDVCFDDVYQEPKSILIVGGCRQRVLAQYIALLLPAADIVLVDTCPDEVRRAEEEICCRFKFVTTPLERLPFESESFDLTLAHNFFAYPQTSWEQALSELSRVTRRNLFISVHRPLLWSLMRRVGGVIGGLRELGLVLPETLPRRFDVLTHVRRYTKIKTMVAPLPWTVWMTEMKPLREEKLVLEPDA